MITFARSLDTFPALHTIETFKGREFHPAPGIEIWADRHPRPAAFFSGNQRGISWETWRSSTHVPAKSPWAPSASWGCPPAPGSSCPSHPPRCSSPSCSYSHSCNWIAPHFSTFHDFLTITSFVKRGIIVIETQSTSREDIHSIVEYLERLPPLIFLNLEGEPALEEGRESVSLPCTNAHVSKVYNQEKIQR